VSQTPHSSHARSDRIDGEPAESVNVV